MNRGNYYRGQTQHKANRFGNGRKKPLTLKELALMAMSLIALGLLLWYGLLYNCDYFPDSRHCKNWGQLMPRR